MEDPTPITPLSDVSASRSAAALRELEARARSASSNRHERLSQLEAQISRQIDTIAESLAEQRASEEAAVAEVNAAQADVAQLREQLDRQSRELTAQSEELAELDRDLTAREIVLSEQVAKNANCEAELAERQQEIERREQSLQAAEAAKSDEGARAAAAEREAAAKREAAWDAERTRFEHERDELNESLAQVRREFQTAERQDAESKSQLAELQRNLANQLAEADALKSEWDKARSTLEEERDELQAALAASRQAPAESQQFAAVAAERDELQQKFDLALTDLQRLRTRVAQLEQELAERPAADQADSSELVAIRAERDAMASRLEALERDTIAPPDAADTQRQADMQRRFELAVEDVRELKTKNAQLEAKLAAAHKPSAEQADAGGMDWESQKRRLLASLEGDAEAGDAESERERLSISHTIEITDAVIAKKDEKIARLEAQLAAGESKVSAAADEKNEQAIDELLDADAIIQEHRQKTAQLEQEMETKLRAAEMEISVERAKLARQKMELEQLRLTLETERQAILNGTSAATSEAPKRRWLSKLGLGSEDGQ